MKQGIVSAMATAALGGMLLAGCDSAATADQVQAPISVAPDPQEIDAPAAETDDAGAAAAAEAEADGPATPAAKPKPAPEPELPGDVLRSDGFGALKLDMSIIKAKRTGLLGDRRSGGDRENCWSYDLLGVNGARIGWVQFGKHDDDDIVGLTTIAVDKKGAAHTPGGIQVGSSPAQVRAAYPDASEFRAGLSGGGFIFLFLEDTPQVSGIAIQQSSWCGTF